MSSRDEVTLPATRPRSRKSLAHVPSSRSMDQENMTTDLGSLASNGKRTTAMDKTTKKSRSKSIGPGGLDALADTSGNRRKSLAVISQTTPRSILKLTMPPLQEIPAHKSTRNGSPRKKTAQGSGQENGTLKEKSAVDDLTNPFEIQGSAAVNETRVTLRTEEEQQAAAREREEKERRELEKEVIARRDARRKSLANRRVSFAPEATLHTWDVVVEYQDSTASSSSTRRASSASGISAASPGPSTPGPNSDPSEPPSTPPEQAEEEETISATPEHQRELHQKKRRRSSGIPPMNFNNPDDEFMSSSPFSGDSVGDDEVEIEDDGANSNSDSEEDEGTTMMSMDGGETTDMSLASVKSASSTGSDRLDKALRDAAKQAGTRGIDYDENGHQSEDESVVASFVPWSQKNTSNDLESRNDQENIDPFINQTPTVKQNTVVEISEDEEMTMDMTGAFGNIIPAQEAIAEDELSMDVTRAFGNIIPNAAPKPANGNRRQSLRRKSVETPAEDETMDFTMAVGSIKAIKSMSPQREIEGDVTMDFTSVVGGVLPSPKPSTRSTRRSLGRTQRRASPSASESEDMTMDMTVAIGGIVQSGVNDLLPDEDDETLGMEMTTAIGGILQPQRSTGSRDQAKKIMELEADNMTSPFHIDAGSSRKPANTSHPVTSDTGSPSMAAFKGTGLRRSTETRQSTTPNSKLRDVTTIEENPTTPPTQATPQLPQSALPSKTPPSKNVIMRTASPKKLFKEDIKSASTPPSRKKTSTTTPNKLFHQDKATGLATPSFVLTPKRRRSSGLGLDRAGLGSPRLAAILDRRQSIGEQAKTFTPGQSPQVRAGVRFQDPRIMENEIDDDRAQEMAREDGRAILEREVNMNGDDKDITLNLKEMIQSLTPKKNPLRGRKSLHVGAATGILGKRPAELDTDDEDEDDGGVKRLKGHQGSPVKGVRLQPPPSKAETIGRATRSARKSLESSKTLSTPTIASPSKSKATTPRSQARFKDAESGAPNVPIPPPSEKIPTDEPQVEDNLDDERIQLQDFLNMTSIRFMELTTTKRRHTVAPRSSAKDFADDTPASLEDCVAAGASTIPMLELFQHACSELKRYISEGRKTVREIETATFEENPPLFQEYISATPDMKIFMDNQLKNVKTHARLLSKATWYEWRMTLLGTVKEALFRTAEGMIFDEEKLDEQQNLLHRVLPQLLRQAESLRSEQVDYKLAAEELANCDPEELNSARQQLVNVDADLAAKKQLLADLQKQLEGKNTELESGKEKKERYLDEIREAEKIREECRGWTSEEIKALKDQVNVIEKTHGWTITGVSGNTTSMTYRKEVELVFDPSSFQCQTSKVRHAKPARIDLWYIGANREINPLPMTLEKEFFLQSIRDHIRSLPQAQTSIKDLLSAVSTSWKKATTVVNDIRLLNISCPTEVSKTSDSSIAIKSSLLISALATKVSLVIDLESKSGETGVDTAVKTTATVIYGERFNEAKISEQLGKKFGDSVEVDVEKESWASVVFDLGEKLLARGRK